MTVITDRTEFEQALLGRSYLVVGCEAWAYTRDRVLVAACVTYRGALACLYKEVRKQREGTSESCCDELAILNSNAEKVLAMTLDIDGNIVGEETP